MIFIPFRPIKCTELAVNVADVRVINVPINNVSYDLGAAAIVIFRLRQISPACRDLLAVFFLPNTDTGRRFSRKKPANKQPLEPPRRFGSRMMQNRPKK